MKKKKKKKLNHRSARKRGEKRFGSETLRPVTLRPAESLRERRKKRELAGEVNRSAMRELGAGQRVGLRNRSAMKVGRRAEG